MKIFIKDIFGLSYRMWKGKHFSDLTVENGKAVSPSGL
jgi:hypothetical protein